MKLNSQLVLDRASFTDKFDREPFGFTHNLSSLGLFQFDSLVALAEKYAEHPRDYFVSASAPSAGTEFFTVPSGQFTPRDAIDRLDDGAIRILLKRPEDHDSGFRQLLTQLFEQVIDLRGGLGSERLVRLEGAVFITSAASTTPFHFDPEIGFFSQIEGEKIYHVYSPASLRETDLEKFYLQDQVGIGQVDLRACDPRLEHVFSLQAGKGLHQPQNSPHWVETRGTRSISYTFVFETNESRSRGRARAFNHYLRKLGFDPFSPGTRPALDAVKAGAMQAIIPARKRLGSMLRTLRQRS
jgi:hypothetical protein